MMSAPHVDTSIATQYPQDASNAHTACHRVSLNLIGFRLDVLEEGDGRMVRDLVNAFPLALEDTSKGAAKRLHIRQHSDGCTLKIDGMHDEFQFNDSWPQIDDFVQFLVVQHFLNEFVFVHAACLKIHDSVALFVGASTCGKTTLAQVLGASGHEILADDMVPLSLNTGCVVPFRTAPRVRPHTRKVLADLRPTTNATLRVHSDPLRPTHLFFLDAGLVADVQGPDIARRDISVGKNAWERFARLAGSAKPRFSSDYICMRGPQYFDREPSVVDVNDSLALKLLLRHLRSPTPAIGSLLDPVARVIRRSRCLALQPGRIDAMRAKILSAVCSNEPNNA